MLSLRSPTSEPKGGLSGLSAIDATAPQVPHQEAQKVPKHIPKFEVRANEKVVSVPQNLIQEVRS